MTAFNHALEFTLRWEGGEKFTDDPDDPGGATKFGISQRAYPNEDIRNLTIDDARRIYRRDYWEACGCDAMPESLAMVVFDYAVNSGVSRSSIALQSELGVSVDGKIGPQTLAAIDGRDTSALVESVLSSRVTFLARLVQRKPAMAKYLNGWMRRVVSLAQNAGGMS